MTDQTPKPTSSDAPWWEHANFRYYDGRPDWIDGTSEFHEMIRCHAPTSGNAVEIGAGPPNKTSDMVRQLGLMSIGLDIESAFKSNEAVHGRVLYDGLNFPFADGSFDFAVADMVMEHVAQPQLLAAELARVLRLGAKFCFRTPQRWGYVAVFSSLTPHWFHVKVANRLRRLPAGTHDPWPTHYRCNTKRKVTKIFEKAGFAIVEMRSREKKPNYGRCSRLMYYAMVAWERVVNTTDLFSGLRNSMYVVVERRAPASPRDE